MENTTKNLTTGQPLPFSKKLEKANFSEIIKLSPSLNSIAKIRRDGDLTPIKYQISVYINEIFNFYRESVGNDLPVILEQFLEIGYMLNGADLQLFKTNCLKGDYKNRVEIIEGREFRIQDFKLTPVVIIDWLKHYIADRGQSFAGAKVTKHQEVKIRPLSETEKQTYELLQAKYKELEKNKPLNNPNDLAKQIQKSLEILFDNHSENEIEGRECTPYIQFEGQIYSKYNFVKTKFDRIWNECLDAWYQFEKETPISKEGFADFAEGYLTTAVQGFEIKKL